MFVIYNIRLCTLSSDDGHTDCILQFGYFEQWCYKHDGVQESDTKCSFLTPRGIAGS